MSQENNLYFDHQALIVNLQESGDFYIFLVGGNTCRCWSIQNDGLKPIMVRNTFNPIGF